MLKKFLANDFGGNAKTHCIFALRGNVNDHSKSL